MWGVGGRCCGLWVVGGGEWTGPRWVTAGDYGSLVTCAVVSGTMTVVCVLVPGSCYGVLTRHLNLSQGIVGTDLFVSYHSINQVGFLFSLSLHSTG